MSKKYFLVPGVLILVTILFFAFSKLSTINHQPSAPTPTPEAVKQLLPDQAPQVSLSFSTDAHYVTVNVTNIHADQIEYNLIYTATVKASQIQTGVNASKKLNGETTYTERQLLGSESSGHFTYHQNIHDATMELTLRDVQNRSVYTATYPFTLSPGSTIDLKASDS